MKRKAVASIAFIFFVLVYAELSIATESRRFGHSGRFAGSFKSGGFRASAGGHGVSLKSGTRHPHGRHFGKPARKIRFTPHRKFSHRPIVPRRGFHSGFFVGHRVIGIPSSSVVIWSRPGTITSYATPPSQGIVEVDNALERPLITIMLRNRHELGLSSEQVRDLENLRDEYQREAIRYDADIRIAEIDLQQLLGGDDVDLDPVKSKLREIEHLKTELRFARLRAIEQGKALLSPEQHEKLQALLDPSRYFRVQDDPSTPVTEE